MECPVCGGNCVRPAREVLEGLSSRFQPCEKCITTIRDKTAPLVPLTYTNPCSCGKRFIDDVFAHMYVIMREEGDLNPEDPLITVGSPLIHPGLALSRPPFLPAKSLVLLSGKVHQRSANRIVTEVPEVMGVVKSGSFIPGLSSLDPTTPPKVYTLLAGCDVRADVYPLPTGSLVIYKQQSHIHLEFPRAGYPKLKAVANHIDRSSPHLFIDACAGPGTLGLAAGCMGVPHILLNDAWYASAFWSAMNADVNKESLFVNEVHILKKYDDMRSHPVAKEPVKIAETSGKQIIEVYQGDLFELYTVLPKHAHPVTALDLFDKNDKTHVSLSIRNWKSHVSGEVFIP